MYLSLLLRFEFPMMMINSCSVALQDTLPVKNVVLKDSFRLNQIKHSVPHISATAQISTVDLTDTTAVCVRNSIADITFHDSNNVVNKFESGTSGRFPYIFTEKNRQMESEARASLIKHLKPGLDIPSRSLHDDWIIIIILIAAFLFSFIRTSSRSELPGVTRFFLFRRINDPSLRDIGGLFQWQSTILNLISFLIIGLFGYSAAAYYGIIPSPLGGIIFWIISLGIIVIAVTIRHIVCMITGNVSGENEAFREYLLGVYHSYRFSALFLFVIIILMSYTVIFPQRVYFISGIIVLGTMYLIRVIRLMIIFINRNISIFYLILYLCALEILPVMVLVKYFTGLV